MAVTATRLDSPAQDIAHRLLGETPADLSIPVDYSKVVLCGARGSGKTTELTRIASLLSREFVPLQLDLARVLPDGSGSVPIVVFFGLAAIRALEEWSTPNDGQERVRVRETTRAFGEALDRLMGAGRAVGRMAEWIRAVGSALQFVPSPMAQVAGSAAVTSAAVSTTLADGLDRETKDAVLHALADSSVLTSFAAPVVLTAPVRLMFAAEYNGLRNQFVTDVLYNVPVRSRGDGGSNEPGVAVLRSVLAKRLAEGAEPVPLSAVWRPADGTALVADRLSPPGVASGRPG